MVNWNTWTWTLWLSSWMKSMVQGYSLFRFSKVYNCCIKFDRLIKQQDGNVSWQWERARKGLNTTNYLPLCHRSSQLFDLYVLSSTDIPILLLNQPNIILALQPYGCTTKITLVLSTLPDNLGDSKFWTAVSRLEYEISWILPFRLSINKISTNFACLSYNF